MLSFLRSQLYLLNLVEFCFSRYSNVSYFIVIHPRCVSRIFERNLTFWVTQHTVARNFNINVDIAWDTQKSIEMWRFDPKNTQKQAMLPSSHQIISSVSEFLVWWFRRAFNLFIIQYRSELT
jgi:hypothetical protein